MRNVEPLKKMLRPHDGIIFIDNEKVFKKALKKRREDMRIILRIALAVTLATVPPKGIDCWLKT